MVGNFQLVFISNPDSNPEATFKNGLGSQYATNFGSEWSRIHIYNAGCM
jgi:hypothetical protein